MNVSIAKPKTFCVPKDTIMNRQVSILSSARIIRPFSQADYINTHIPTTTLEFAHKDKDYVVGFSSNDDLYKIKSHMLHPYPISRVAIKDLIQYMRQSGCSIVIFSHKSSYYTATCIDVDTLKTSEDLVPMEIHELDF